MDLEGKERGDNLVTCDQEMADGDNIGTPPVDQLDDMLDELNGSAGPQGTPVICCISPAKELPAVPTPLLTSNVLAGIRLRIPHGGIYEHADRTFTFSKLYSCNLCGTRNMSGQSNPKIKCGTCKKTFKQWTLVDEAYDLRFFRTSKLQILASFRTASLTRGRPNHSIAILPLSFKMRLESFMDQSYDLLL
jgi:hypothetical protein